MVEALQRRHPISIVFQVFSHIDDFVLLFRFLPQVPSGFIHFSPDPLPIPRDLIEATQPPTCFRSFALLSFRHDAIMRVSILLPYLSLLGQASSSFFSHLLDDIVNLHFKRSLFLTILNQTSLDAGDFYLPISLRNNLGSSQDRRRSRDDEPLRVDGGEYLKTQHPLEGVRVDNLRVHVLKL